MQQPRVGDLQTVTDDIVLSFRVIAVG